MNLVDPRRYFGGETRAVDGCIVTYELEDGSIHVERFNQTLLHTQTRRKRTLVRLGDPYIEQAARRADELGALIVCVSTPQTILTDLQGSREKLEPQRTGREGAKGGMQQAAPNVVAFPEIYMLGKIKRLDLFRYPRGGFAGHNIRQVTGRRATHSGSNQIG